MLTGDTEQNAKKIAQELEIDRYFARLLPQEKANIVKEFTKKGEIVTMAGDGINDSVALATSNIAVAMGSGTDASIGVSDVVLLDDNIQKLYRAFRISKRTYRAIKENLTISLLYNTIAIPMAMAGWVTPLVAALSMSLSSLFVVANSMRIRI